MFTPPRLKTRDLRLDAYTRLKVSLLKSTACVFCLRKPGSAL